MLEAGTIQIYTARPAPNMCVWTQAHTGGWCLASLGGEASSLIWGSPAWIALACLPQTCFFLLSLPKEGLNLLENR